MNEAEKKADEANVRDVIVWERRSGDRGESEASEATVRTVPIGTNDAGDGPRLRIVVVSSGFGAAPARVGSARTGRDGGLRMAA